MNLQPTLENELVIIKPLGSSDLESLYQVAKDPKIWEQHPCKRYLRAEFEKFFSESINSNGALSIIDKISNRIIGSSRYKKNYWVSAYGGNWLDFSGPSTLGWKIQ